MAISNDNPDLFAAILAMDAYNRGYNNAVLVEGNQIGNATLTRAIDPDVDTQAVERVRRAAP